MKTASYLLCSTHSSCLNVGSNVPFTQRVLLATSDPSRRRPKLPTFLNICSQVRRNRDRKGKGERESNWNVFAHTPKQLPTMGLELNMMLWLGCETDVVSCRKLTLICLYWLLSHHFTAHSLPHTHTQTWLFQPAYWQLSIWWGSLNITRTNTTAQLQMKACKVHSLKHV